MSERRVPRWLVAIGVLPAIFAIAIMIFIARYSIAHDEARCAFREVETRELGPGVQVREDARRCLPEIEEHRWTAIRQGAPERELGRFPLESDQIDRGFPWSARLEDGRAIVTIQNEGRGELVFREPGADAGI